MMRIETELAIALFIVVSAVIMFDIFMMFGG